MNILYVVHNLGNNIPASKSSVIEGGCEKFTYNLARELSLEHTCYILYPNISEGSETYLHKVQNYRNIHVETMDLKSKFEKLDYFRYILKEKEIDVIHYQHLIYSLVEYTIVGKSMDIPQILTAHDYFYICEEHFLENDKFVTCDVPKNIVKCVSCLKNKYKIEPSKVQQRRNIMRSLLGIVDKVVVPSKSLRTDYFKIFPEINDKLSIHPIGITKAVEEEYTPYKKGDVLEVGIPNYITNVKGWVHLINVIRMCEKITNKIRFRIICDNMVEVQDKYLRNFRNVALMPQEFEGVHLMWLTSVARETFSLLVSETILRKVPIMSGNGGALKERLSDDIAFTYDMPVNPEKIVGILLGILEDDQELQSKAKAILKHKDGVPMIHESSRYYDHQYQKLSQKQK